MRAKVGAVKGVPQVPNLHWLGRRGAIVAGTAVLVVAGIFTWNAVNEGDSGSVTTPTTNTVDTPALLDVATSRQQELYERKVELARAFLRDALSVETGVVATTGNSVDSPTVLAAAIAAQRAAEATKQERLAERLLANAISEEQARTAAVEQQRAELGRRFLAMTVGSEQGTSSEAIVDSAVVLPEAIRQ